MVLGGGGLKSFYEYPTFALAAAVENKTFTDLFVSRFSNSSQLLLENSDEYHDILLPLSYFHHWTLNQIDYTWKVNQNNIVEKISSNIRKTIALELFAE